MDSRPENRNYLSKSKFSDKKIRSIFIAFNEFNFAK